MKRTARDIRRRNRFEVLRSVYATAGSVTRQDITATTGLSFATVANLTAEMLEAGVLVEAGQEDSGGGRPRTRLTVNAERGALVGVDVSETQIHVELYDLALSVLGSLELRLPRGAAQPDDVADLIVTGVDRVLSAENLDSGKVLGVGVSVPGPVDPEGGVSLFSPYWSWRDVPLRALLAQRLDLPLYVDNPLKASTVAEMWFGSGRSVDDLVFVTLRSGVGAGVTIDGSLYRGITNTAGEWGHTCLVMDGRLCRCGNYGCVETYVGASGIMQTLREFDTNSPLLHPDDEVATIDALSRAADDGDPIAIKVIAETGRYLGAAVANLINLFNPQLIVLGDWVATSLGDRLLQVTREIAAGYALPQPFRAVTLQLCALPHNPASVGAATFALEGFLDAQAVTTTRARSGHSR